jgi:hypothetical protein
MLALAIGAYLLLRKKDDVGPPIVGAPAAGGLMASPPGGVYRHQQTDLAKSRGELVAAELVESGVLDASLPSWTAVSAALAIKAGG